MRTEFNPYMLVPAPTADRMKLNEKNRFVYYCINI